MKAISIRDIASIKNQKRRHLRFKAWLRDQRHLPRWKRNSGKVWKTFVKKQKEFAK